MVPVFKEWFDRIGFALVVVGVFALGILQGQYQIVIRVEVATYLLAVAFAQAVMASIGFTLFTLLSGAALVVKLALRGADDDVAPSGRVTAIVPVYQDADALHRSVESLLETRYADYAIRIVLEEDDTPSILEAERLADRYDAVEYLVNTGYPGSKAGAINYAAEQTDSEYVAVFDADEQVHSRFIGHAVAKLAAGADVVQGRTVPQPTGMIESLAYAESVLLSYGARQVLYVLTGFRMAASRAVVMHRETFESLGGYDEEMLTEDFAFAYTCYKERLDVRQTLRFCSRIEAAHTFMDWWGQRKRWMTGYAQVFHQQVRDVRPVTDYRNVLAVVFTGSTLWGSLFMFSLLSKFTLLALGGQIFLLVAPLLAAVLVTVAVGIVDRRRGAIDTISPLWLFVPVVLPLYSLAALKALIEYLTSWDGEWYRVSKGLE
ncbi:MAG: glycosyltransferase family 2 protein [Haloarculaceae archaeon]